MPGSTKWRLAFPAVGSGWSAISEVKMFAAGSLTNLCTGGTATSSSNYSGYSPARAFDGIANTQWLTMTARPQWLQYEFGSAQSITAIAILGSSTAEGMPTDFTLDYWDGGVWVTVLTITGDTQFSYLIERTFSTVPKQVWRLAITASQSGDTWIQEMEMHASIGGGDQCAGGIVSAFYRWDASTSFTKAFDDDISTGWWGGSVPTWLQYTFPVAVDIIEYVLRAGSNSSNAQLAPKTFKLQYNDGAGGWTDFDTQTSLANWSANEVRTFSSPNTTAPTAGAVSITASTPTSLTVNVGAGSDNVGVTSRTLRVYSNSGRTSQVGSDIAASVGDNVVGSLSASTHYWLRVVYADAAANTANGDADGTTLESPEARVYHLSAEIAEREPSNAEVHILQVEVADAGDDAQDRAEVHGLYAEIARRGESAAEVCFLAIEIACRTTGLPPSEFPALKRLDLAAGTWNGSRRRWEARMHRKQADGTWKRLVLPSWAVLSCQFTDVIAGGMAEAVATFAKDFKGLTAYRADDRLSVWVRRSAVWEEWYRGAVTSVDASSGRPGQVGVTATGPMKWTDRIRVSRRYAMPFQDVAQLFARLISDYLDPWCEINGIPRFIRDIQDVGEEAGTRDFDGSLTDALQDCLGGVPGVAWGLDLTGTGAYRVFLYPRPTATTSCVALGKDVETAALGEDWAGLVNAIELIGAESQFPNLLVNGGFEKPTGEAVNLLANASFEDEGANALDPAHWQRTVGEGSRKASNQDNVGAVTGSYYLELDTTNEEVLSDFTAETSAGVYEFRCWVAREDSAYTATPKIDIEVYSVAESLLATVNVCGGTSGRNWTPATQAWEEKRFAFTIATATVKLKARISHEGGGGGYEKGLAIDDVMLFDRTGIKQEGWVLEIIGTADVLPTYDDSPAPQRDYYVSFDLDTTGGSMKYRPEQAFSLRDGQEVRFQVQLRSSAAMTVRVGVETYNGSSWTDSGVNNSVPASANWVTYHHDVSGGGETREARPYISVPATMVGVLDVDAAYVFAGHPGTDRAFEDGEANLTLWLSTDDAFVQSGLINGVAVTVPAAVKTSITDHGRREARVQAPRVRDVIGAQRFALNYFLSRAVARTPGPLSVRDRLRHYRFDGLVRLANIPGGGLDTPLFPVRFTHNFDAAGWKCEVERDVERPNSITLWRDLETKVEDTYQSARVGIQALQTSQQKG